MKTAALASLCLILSSCAGPQTVPTEAPVISTIVHQEASATPVPPTQDRADGDYRTCRDRDRVRVLDYQWAEKSPAPDIFSVIRIEPGSAKVKDILQAEAAESRRAGRHPYIEFYADWCPPCNAIKDNLGDPRMVEAFAGTYIIKLDTDEWGDKLSGTGLYVPAIPAFYELGADGKPTGRMITGAAWGEDVPANIAPPMKAFFEGN